MEILAVSGLTFTYPQCSEPAIDNISFSLRRGEFAVLCGATGSGKSTLLRMLKRELTPLGDKKGSIFFDGSELSELSSIRSATAIGFVMQKPEQQTVTDKVWHELAFGLENIGTPPDEISRRIAEMASYFGIGSWFGTDVAELSGGQKQLLNLASILVMQPELLILDEPTAQLDPIAAADFIAALRRLCSDMSITILIAEHRLEDVVPLCDRLLVMDGGRLIADDPPSRVIADLRDRSDIICGMPAASRLYAQLRGEGSCPLTVREGRSFIESSYGNSVSALPVGEYKCDGSTALEFSGVYFRYSREGKDILDGLSLKIYEREIFCLLGGNGSGKTTFSGKLANWQKTKKNRKPLLVACDVYRPAAIEQLKVVGESVGVDVYTEPGNMNPVEIAQNALREAKQKEYNLVIVDTAGRLAVDEQMMNEIANLKEALHPDETLFVVDSMTGQDAVNTAKEFNERLDFSGIVLTKLDGDTRGGAALSIRTVVDKPIKFIGTGEKMDALDVFHPAISSSVMGGSFSRAVLK